METGYSCFDRNKKSGRAFLRISLPNPIKWPSVPSLMVEETNGKQLGRGHGVVVERRVRGGAGRGRLHAKVWENVKGEGNREMIV